MWSEPGWRTQEEQGRVTLPTPITILIRCFKRDVGHWPHHIAPGSRNVEVCAVLDSHAPDWNFSSWRWLTGAHGLCLLQFSISNRNTMPRRNNHWCRGWGTTDTQIQGIWLWLLSHASCWKHHFLIFLAGICHRYVGGAGYTEVQDLILRFSQLSVNLLWARAWNISVLACHHWTWGGRDGGQVETCDLTLLSIILL